MPAEADPPLAPQKRSKKGLLLALGAGLLILATVMLFPWSGTTQPLSEHYRLVGKDQDIVEDTRTKLQWQRCSLGQTWNGATCAGEATEYKWDDAQRIAPAGWRLPTEDELAGLVYCSSGEPAYWKTEFIPCIGTYKSPTIWSVAFPNTPVNMFWSSSPFAGYSGLVWHVSFSIGAVGPTAKSSALNVRLVRGGH
jgi:hypothetical protein